MIPRGLLFIKSSIGGGAVSRKGGGHPLFFLSDARNGRSIRSPGESSRAAQHSAAQRSTAQHSTQIFPLWPRRCLRLLSSGFRSGFWSGGLASWSGGRRLGLSADSSRRVITEQFPYYSLAAAPARHCGPACFGEAPERGSLLASSGKGVRRARRGSGGRAAAAARARAGVVCEAARGPPRGLGKGRAEPAEPPERGVAVVLIGKRGSKTGGRS